MKEPGPLGPGAAVSRWDPLKDPAGVIRAILLAVAANSGGSNTGDGTRGLETARSTQAVAAELLGVEPAQVGVASTGVIGTELPREKLLSGLRNS